MRWESWQVCIRLGASGEVGELAGVYKSGCIR